MNLNSDQYYVTGQALLSVTAATPFWDGVFASEHLLDGNLNRNQDEKSCYHTIQVDLRPDNDRTPYVNFTLSSPMEVVRVLVVPRDYHDQTDPILGVVDLRVLACNNPLECRECEMENKEAIRASTEKVVFDCERAETNLLVLTNDDTAHVIACEVMAYGYE